MHIRSFHKKTAAYLAIMPMLFLSSCQLPQQLQNIQEEMLPSRTFDKIPKPKPIITKDLQKKKLPPQEKQSYFQDEIKLLWPCKGKVVKQFKENDDEGKPSPGVHILGSAQASVRAGMDGMVSYSGPHKKFINVVVITKGKIKLAYGYLEGVLPAIGSQISAGQIIGTLSSKQPILYMALQKDTLPVNPLEYMQ
jgi:septal ring factor EnvC (AmiA/AmiB activator)